MMKTLDMSKINPQETTELWVKARLNLIYGWSKFICMAFQMTSEPEMEEAAKKAALDTAYNMAVSASEIYCRLKEVYDTTEED